MVKNKWKNQNTKSEFNDITIIKERKPTTLQTLIVTIILCCLTIIFMIVGMSLKLAYGPSLYYRDENYWLAAIGLSLVAISFPLGITATCLLNTLCRIKRYVEYIEARKQMLESQVTETNPDKVVYK
ncbi:cGMP-specific 3',5'-cyclic phosphodiesterase, variant 2 [Schistosoma haematobium]|uniref:cGMP-specific 3',5'-cyclic phosphodiesterase, variant 2 n=2 Tax=Schistosoma haematobium TaxID=6185 RepID=A0A6A5DEY1_SCHHA|nr:cGMP-specific 3',5'-cyclic phosphodiesterase, variant 2 [Schistosoma haematobium]KAH9579610.1 cGMP-specific 3',5'-cyclic phosphodiesterase, variant 2 [Schistosoma haematobium]